MDREEVVLIGFLLHFECPAVYAEDENMTYSFRQVVASKIKKISCGKLALVTHYTLGDDDTDDDYLGLYIYAPKLTITASCKGYSYGVDIPTGILPHIKAALSWGEETALIPGIVKLMHEFGCTGVEIEPTFSNMCTGS